LIYNDNIQIKETIKNFGRFNIKFRIYTCKTIKHKEALEYMIKEESLCDISLYGNKKNDYNSWAGEYYNVSDKNPNLILKQWTIELNHPNSSDLTLTIESFDTIKKGPWIIDIPGNAIKN
jgi:hypothetical protein